MRSLGDLLCTETVWIGTHSVIYRAIDPATNDIYAVREVDCSELSDDSIYFYMLRQEGPLLDSLEHSNIISPVMHSADYDDNILWLVFPLYRHGSLFDVLERFRKCNTLPSAPLIYSVISALSQALRYLHTSAALGNYTGLLHRNITSKSVFVADDGTVLLSGFDFACPLTLLADEEQLQVYGSRVYAPPELGDKMLTTASDVWALGCLVYEMCTCSPLFADAVQESKREFHVSDITLQTPELSKLCQRMLSLNPTERITIDEILADQCVYSSPKTVLDLLPTGNPPPRVS
ncbi:Kinase, NEK [Giardia lamblia P15]|uniref:non-specific serine/threonine protein kinase n=1 Tax=Giardia intestinalis (strain P15) TaxID=658858 RepID=E1F675_GIAIA|nr:Kinase, NEK [Giardia lamblia P15]